MYFDELLWRSLLSFAQQYVSDSEVTVILDDAANEIGAAEFLRTASVPIESPPNCIVVRYKQRIVLSVVTEFWNRIGGPVPYADSYTYAIYSQEDLSQPVMTFLRSANASKTWDISTEVLPPIPLSRGLWARLIDILGS